MPKRKTNEEFITEATLIHNGKYTYPRCNYEHHLTKITATCGVHGDWQVKPKIHTNKTNPTGCPKCGIAKQTKSRLMTHEQFEVRARLVHGNLFDYPEKYEHGKKPLNIKCCTCGLLLLRSPSHHLSGLLNCPGCKDTMTWGHYSKKWCEANPVEAQQIIKLYWLRFDDHYKIGLTKRSLKKRFRKTKVRPDETMTVWELPAFVAGAMEKLVKSEFRKYQHDYASLVDNGATECFLDVEPKSVISWVNVYLKENYSEY